MYGAIGVIVVIVLIFLFSAIKILPEYERGVILTLGRYTGIKGPGLILLVPVLQRIIRVDLRINVMDVPPQDVITYDNVSIHVNAVVYFRVVDSDKAVLQVSDFYAATSQLAQTRLRSVLGQHELDEILAKRDQINHVLQESLDLATDPWGIKISDVEMKDVDIDESMVRAIARQAEAERDRRAKVIHAEGEYQAAEKLRDAAGLLAQQSQALQLRYLQTMADLGGTGKASTIVFPLPLDLIKPLTEFFKRGPATSEPEYQASVAPEDAAADTNIDGAPEPPDTPLPPQPPATQ
jgi:regulator of protease activity HflC (stomatin/prohibitin superfamily)